MQRSVNWMYTHSARPHNPPQSVHILWVHKFIDIHGAPAVISHSKHVLWFVETQDTLILCLRPAVPELWSIPTAQLDLRFGFMVRAIGSRFPSLS